jgi:hypothetical protein
VRSGWRCASSSSRASGSGSGGAATPRSGGASDTRCRSLATGCRSACWPRPTPSSCRGPAGDPFWWTPAGFLLGAGIAIAIGLRVTDEGRLGTLYQRLLGAACLLLPVLRLATGGMDWAEALLGGQTDVLTVDLLLLVAGAALCWHARGRVPRRRLRAIPGPAE